MVDSRVQQLTIQDGEDLLEALRQVVSVGDGWVLGSGIVEQVQVQASAEGVDVVRVIDSRATLASLSGPAGGPYQVLVARASEAGFELVGGALLRARAVQVEAIWFPTGTTVAGDRPSDSLASPASQPQALEPPPGARWAALAAAAAEAAQAAEPEEPAHRPKPGDRVQHFAFGLCDVLRTNGDTLTIRDAKGPARVREIRIDMLEVRAPTQQDGRLLYELARKR